MRWRRPHFYVQLGRDAPFNLRLQRVKRRNGRIVVKRRSRSIEPPEQFLCRNDPTLASVIAGVQERWPTQRSEDPIWGLIRIVIAQQVSTERAHQITDRVKAAFPEITNAPGACTFEYEVLRGFGVPEKRARCCVTLCQ